MKKHIKSILGPLLGLLLYFGGTYGYERYQNSKYEKFIDSEYTEIIRSIKEEYKSNPDSLNNGNYDECWIRVVSATPLLVASSEAIE
jgi:hypothetical protein